MNYKDYKNKRYLVWEILIRERITELPVRVSELCRNMGIPILLHEFEDGNSGAAHELGHIMLGHVGKYKLVNREPSPNDNPIEQAANIFASRLLAPACVLWGCNIHTADEIAVNCKISRQAAEYRAARMEILYKRNAFLTSSLEREVYENFRQYIETHKL